MDFPVFLMLGSVEGGEGRNPAPFSEEPTLRKLEKAAVAVLGFFQAVLDGVPPTQLQLLS